MLVIVLLPGIMSKIVALIIAELGQLRAVMATISKKPEPATIEAVIMALVMTILILKQGMALIAMLLMPV